jgi:hypothetical protein
LITSKSPNESPSGCSAAANARSRWRAHTGEEDPAVDRASISAGGLTTTFVAVPDRDAAVAAAVELVDDGAQTIELCGGFGSATAARVVEAVGDRVPV